MPAEKRARQRVRIDARGKRAQERDAFSAIDPAAPAAGYVEAMTTSNAGSLPIALPGRAGIVRGADPLDDLGKGSTGALTAAAAALGMTIYDLVNHDRPCGCSRSPRSSR
jgi:hypothetical protein